MTVMGSDEERPDAFIQWKGTDACLDLYCTCGEQFHFDGYFAYELTCGRCGQTYELPNTLRIYPVEPSRGLTLVFDGQEVIKAGEFEVPWPRPGFDAVKPGGIFEIHDDIAGGSRIAHVDFIRATANEGGTMTLLVRNRDERWS